MCALFMYIDAVWEYTSLNRDTSYCHMFAFKNISESNMISAFSKQKKVSQH